MLNTWGLGSAGEVIERTIIALKVTGSATVEKRVATGKGTIKIV